MDKINLDPYIFFQGNAKQAMEFYKGVFGGELTMQSFSEVPGDVPGKKEHPDWLMHSMLDGDVKLMASDSDKASPEAKKVDLSLSGTDDTKLRKIFDSLSEEGKVTSPLEKQFWGDTFGMLTDKFGIEWMVNINTKKA